MADPRMTASSMDVQAETVADRGLASNRDGIVPSATLNGDLGAVS